MAQKCVHQGCGKTYTDADEVCRYHPGPPVFHEGQKGWSCCKPRVLTFEEFMDITPCAEGKHSTTDLPPKVEKKKESPEAVAAAAAAAAAVDAQFGPAVPRNPINVPVREKAAAPAAAGTATSGAPSAPDTPVAPPESEDDEPSLEIPVGRVCRRRGCGVAYAKGGSREAESCVHHPGAPIFHEGSKGYTCCKRRVLEFDQFMKIEGCQTKGRHLFVGSGRKDKGSGAGEELLETVRTDFYQSSTVLTVSFFLKKIDKDKAVIRFLEEAIDLDLPTTDSPVKRYKTVVPLYAAIDPARSSFKVLGTKLEVVLAKADVSSWPVLRSDDRLTGEIIQTGRAARA
ncbi:cord and cs domain containing protein [Grosmannia clavigera kw1407]|uniref:Cord and cs domain containing protein n=1 Tax=Grosmannia clavigera (strain kw1407 / UAMH 11150) TaxID=655863 RepID=F0XDB6_GROCL|nr:cord and cs domain containing protein [Grosmannia clavigera kw1407]EFX03714.1 cord and cs domain containing protein [Grosmannia clavigera kw1407]